jgi:transposase-like protein
MNVLDFEKIVRSEKTAKHFMLTRCSMVADIRCPSCANDRLYEVEGGKRRRCPRCGHTFNPYAGRYLNNVKLSANKWLWVVKLFELATSATVIADETGLSYPTALKAGRRPRAGCSALRTATVRRRAPSRWPRTLFSIISKWATSASS